LRNATLAPGLRRCRITRSSRSGVIPLGVARRGAPKQPSRHVSAGRQNTPLERAPSRHMNGEPGAPPAGNRVTETGTVDQNQAIDPFRSHEREA
jgi:hypothetical protein